MRTGNLAFASVRLLSATLLLCLLAPMALAEDAPELSGQGHPAFDLEATSARFQRDSWPLSPTVLEGVELPADGMPGLPRALVQAESGFERIGETVVSRRIIQALIEPVEEGADSGIVDLQVVVASSVESARDALLTTLGETRSMVGLEWDASPYEQPDPAWLVLGEVRFGLRRDDGHFASIALVRANVAVFVRTIGSGHLDTLRIARAVDALIQRTPQRASDGPALTGLMVAGKSPLPLGSHLPLHVFGNQLDELELEFGVTGGGVQPRADGSRGFYAGESGAQRIWVSAMDSFGFPSRIEIEVEVEARQD